jgi:hypothetical protein
VQETAILKFSPFIQEKIMSTPFLVKDIFPGLSGSFPGYPTALYSFTNKCQNKDVDVGYSNGKFCDDK